MTEWDDTPTFDIQTHHVALSVQQRQDVERTFWLTLGKFQSALERVDVSIAPAESSESDWAYCQVTVRAHDRTSLLVEGVDRDVIACITRALRRAERELRRRILGRRRDKSIELHGVA